MSWDAIEVKVTNESPFWLKPSSSDSKTFNNATLLEGSDELRPVSKNGVEIIGKFGSAGAAGQATACLSLDIGDLPLRLVVWLWMYPELGIADVNAAIYPADDHFKPSALLSLRPHEIDAGSHPLLDEGTFGIRLPDKQFQLYVCAVIQVDMLDLNETDPMKMGTPTASVYLKDLSYTPPPPEPTGDSETAFFKIAGGPAAKFKQPVHETMTIAALIDAGLLPRDMTYKKARNESKDAFEYCRGVVWNDDPGCLLFMDLPNDNSFYATGTEWYIEYSGASQPKFLQVGNNEADAKERADRAHIIHRSHYGNLQFLHSMGCEKNEDPNQTRRKTTKWIETMYKLSIGSSEVNGDTRIDAMLGEFFTEETIPKGSNTMRQLILASTPNYQGVDLGKRALGICFHMIQDSYAIGHTERVLSNPGDKRVSKASITQWDQLKDGLSTMIATVAGKEPVQQRFWRFAEGSPGIFLGVKNFHTYDGQDEDRHGHYDEAPNLEALREADINSFNDILGAKNAILACSQLATYCKEKRPWVGGSDPDHSVERFITEGVYQLTGATGSNVDVDQGFGVMPADEDYKSLSDIIRENKRNTTPATGSPLDWIRDNFTKSGGGGGGSFGGILFGGGSSGGGSSGGGSSQPKVVVVSSPIDSILSKIGGLFG